eukprot:3507326-Amphidinium_carterae.1
MSRALADVTGSYDHNWKGEYERVDDNTGLESEAKVKTAMTGADMKRTIARAVTRLFLRTYNHYTTNHCTTGAKIPKSQARAILTMCGLSQTDEDIAEQLDDLTKAFYVSTHAFSACKGAAIWMKTSGVKSAHARFPEDG